MKGAKNINEKEVDTQWLYGMKPHCNFTKMV